MMKKTYLPPFARVRIVDMPSLLAGSGDEQMPINPKDPTQEALSKEIFGGDGDVTISSGLGTAE